MPVPLILSDLPPAVEQPAGVVIPEATAEKRVLSATPRVSDLLSHGPWVDMSPLSRSVLADPGSVSSPKFEAILPPWLTENRNGSVGWGNSASADLAPWVTNGPDTGNLGQGAQGNDAPDNVGVEGNSEAQSDPVQEADTNLDINTELENFEEAPAPQGPLTSDDITELILQADEQAYDPLRQVVTAEGNVLVQFGDAQLAAERLWVNLNNRYLRAEGDVFFNRNNQTIEGETATYNLLQGSGEISEARGELALEQIEEDFSAASFTNESLTAAPIDYRLQGEGSISEVTSPGGITLGSDSNQNVFGGEQGRVTRIRFESEKIYFDADGWYSEELRLTNDPFSPPELEIRGNSVSLVPLNEEEAELYIESPRLVFDQGLTLPVLKERYILQRGQLAPNELNPLPTGIGFDGRDRDGLFIERAFSLDTGGPLQFTVVPQLYLGRWRGEGNTDLFDPANVGVVARLNGPITPGISANGVFSLPGLDLENFADRMRASFRTQQLIGDHRLSFEYSYRDRLFNGSLGFQDVQTSLGVLLRSPVIELGDTQLNLTYQVSGQYVTADTDQPDLLPAGDTLGLTDLFRFQGAVDLNRSFSLWRGDPLPATPTEGLRYSPRALVPFLSLGVGLRGVATYYTSNDLQETLEARVSLTGQLGHLSRNFFDYTNFNIGYSTTFVGGDDSPFLFDRSVDTNVLSGGIIQQIYGPLLAGFQTSFNLDSGDEIDTDFILEYRRRAYGILLRYSPERETGFVGLRISNFDWTGRTRPFDAEATNAGVTDESVMVE